MLAVIQSFRSTTKLYDNFKYIDDQEKLSEQNVCKNESLLKEIKRKHYYSLNSLKPTREIPLKQRTRISKNRMKQTLTSSKDSSRLN